MYMVIFFLTGPAKFIQGYISIKRVKQVRGVVRKYNVVSGTIGKET